MSTKNINPDSCYPVDVNSILMKTNSCLIFDEPLLICDFNIFYKGISKKAEQSTFHKGFEEYENASFKK